jgi:outer membrane cobalamin receptor
LARLFMILMIISFFTMLLHGSEDPEPDACFPLKEGESDIADADENDKPIQITLGEVVVTATRTGDSVFNVPQHVTIITDEEIKKTGVKNLSEVLEKKTGLSVSDYGPEGSLKSVTIRGSTTAQVLVLVNGIRANGSHGGADMSLIPLDNVERIEIIRGGMSALYGADAVAGVINIITRKKGKPFFRIKLENGSFLPQQALRGSGSSEYLAPPDFISLIDTQKLHLGFSLPLEPLSITCSLNGIRAANEYAFIDLTNERRIRENADLLGCDGSIELCYDVKDGHIGFSGSGLYHEHGVPGQLGSLTPDSVQKELQFGGTLGFMTEKLFTDLLTLDLKGYCNYYSLDYTDPHNAVDSTHDSLSTGCDLAQEVFLTPYFSLLYGGTFSYDRLESTDMGNRQRINSAGFIEIPISPSSYFTIQPAARYDYFSDFGNSFTCKAGFIWHLSESQSIKGGFAHSFRAPTFNDLYWPADSFAEGNPGLEPETGYSGDLGISGVNRNISYNLFGFFRYIEDVILWLPGTDNIWRPSNHGRGIYPGIEASCAIGFLDTFQVSLDYTFIYSFALTGDIELWDDKRVPSVPLHNLTVQLTHNGEKIMYYISAHYEGKRYLSATSNAFLDPYLLVDLHFKLFLTKDATLFFSIDNLFDESPRSIGNYPLPGCMFRTGFELIYQ